MKKKQLFFNENLKEIEENLVNFGNILGKI